MNLKNLSVRWMTLILVFVAVPALARGPAAYGPNSLRFGAGLYLGEPTGITLKGYLNRRVAVDGIVSWSFVDDAFTLISDVTYDFFDLPIDTNVVTVPFYAGAGGKFGVARENSKRGNRAFGGIRIPVGLAVQWTQYPVEVFLELGPGIEVAPATEFDMTGGVGARFYF